MKKPGYPNNEARRQKEVEKYQLLDTLPEESYDTITSLMAYVCNVPISLVSILDKDRNFLKSHHGVPFNEDPRERSFCGHAILEDEEIMIVNDASEDDRFNDNPLVTEMGVRFYAGAPLINPEGYKIGTLCIFDLESKELDQSQIDALVNMSKQVTLILEERYKNIKLLKIQEELLKRNENLKKFVQTVSHDMKSPLANIIGLTDLLESSLKGKIDDETANYIELMTKSSWSLKNYIDGLMEFYSSEELLKYANQKIKTKGLFQELSDLFATEQKLDIKFDTEIEEFEVNKAALIQILVNLVTNGLKYNDKEQPTISLRVSELSNKYKFEVEDNGIGMAEKETEGVFDLFQTNNKLDRHGKKGTGLGLPTVKKLIEKLEGSIWLHSKPKVGTVVHFTLSK